MEVSTSCFPEISGALPRFSRMICTSIRIFFCDAVVNSKTLCKMLSPQSIHSPPLGVVGSLFNVACTLRVAPIIFLSSSLIIPEQDLGHAPCCCFVLSGCILYSDRDSDRAEESLSLLSMSPHSVQWSHDPRAIAYLSGPTYPPVGRSPERSLWGKEKPPTYLFRNRLLHI